MLASRIAHDFNNLLNVVNGCCELALLSLPKDSSVRGQGIIANEFIKVINTKWRTSIPLINVSLIPGSLILAKRNLLGLPIFEKGTLDNLLF
jgi:hypothetical protein